ncbi:MAG: hypothetical protein HQL26_04920 [Candidatus Omnitrophica bacterium]|nr:hypothetical protein [Candidatus Omnitrophota bacterium]
MRNGRYRMLRLFNLAVLTMFVFCYLLVFNVQAVQNDDDLRIKIVGSWAETIGGMDGISTFYAGGRYECKGWDSVSKKIIIEHAEGSWWIDNGKLYNKLQSIIPSSFPFQKALYIDIIVSISDDTMTLIDEKGIRYTKTRVSNDK